MPGTVNVVIAQAGAGKIGAVGATEAACRDLGSIVEVSLTAKSTTYSATQANRGHQVVAKSKGPTAYTLAIITDEVTAANLAASIDAHVDGAGNIVVNSQDMAMAYWSGYFHGFMIEGLPKTLHVLKASATPDSSIKLGTKGEQQLVQLSYDLLADVTSVLVDSDGKPVDVLRYLSDSLDVTAPTATVVPAAAATAIPKTAGGTVVWTFSKPIRAEDVDDSLFFVHNATGVMIPGTLSRTDTTVTFSWTGALTPTTLHYAIAKHGIRDVAGNRMVADLSTSFTTAA